MGFQIAVNGLRGGSWANLTVKLVGQNNPIWFEKFTGSPDLNPMGMA
jgi:hypothetical protein